MIFHTPDGVRNWLPKDCADKNRIVSSITGCFEHYAYLPIETPSFEYAELFTNISKRTAKDLYKFFDREGNTIALRADMTPPIARSAAFLMHQEPLPYRLYYVGSVFRAAESFQGKPGEQMQAGIELIGDDSAHSDAEVLAVLLKSLQTIGLSQFKLDVGESNYLRGVLEEAGLHKKAIKGIEAMLADKNYIGIEAILVENTVPESIERMLLHMPALIGQGDKLEELYEQTNSKKSRKAIGRLMDIDSILKDYQLDTHLTYDLSMMNQLKYYTGIIFRGYTYDVGFSIADGGRYDTLLSKFGRGLPAVGFSMKIYDILGALKRQGALKESSTTQTLLVYTDITRKLAFETADILRKDDLALENCYYTSLENHKQYAKAKGMGGILYFKDAQTIVAIDLTTDTQTNLTIDEVLNKKP